MFLLITTTANAGNYTWNGATSTNWSTTSNWSPAGVPNTNDTVTLSNGGVNSILLDGNRTITRLVISANTINLNTYELHVSSRSSLNGGAINNGNLKIRGTYAYFQGTNFNCILDVIAGQIKFSGGTFDKTGSFEQNGSASGYGEGGCTFNDDVTIKNTGTVYLRMGQDAGDTFNGKVYLYSSGNYSLQMAYGDTSYFNDTIYVNSTGNGGINFANGTYGASILGDSACLVTGSTGISAGTIQFKNIVQSATSSNSITASGSVLFNVYSNNFLGKVNFTAPNLVVKSTIFGDSTSLTKTGHTLNNTWDGANVYNGVVTITNGNTSTAYVKLASQNADTYNKDVYFNAGTGAIQAANAGTNIYNGNVSVNGNNVTFNTSGGTLKFAGEENQEFGGGTNTLTFNKLIVDKASGNVTLNQPITIDSLLQLTSGIIYTDSIITLKATATTSGASNLSFVDGTLKKIGNTAFVFPVGHNGQWNPIEITAPSQTTDAFTARFYLLGQNYGKSADTTIRLLNTCSYWNLARTTGSSNVYVSLYWDSIACGLYDTTGLIVSAWNGSSWKNVEKDGSTGNVKAGKVKSLTLTNYYLAFTWGYKAAPGKPNIIPIQPVLNISSSDLSWNHSISEDYFGYNGSSVLDAGQHWSDLAEDPANSYKPVLLHNGISNIRINGGTNGNFWDWRTGWFIPENELPYNLFYTRSSHKKVFPSTQVGGFFVNDMAHIKTSNDAVASRPIFQFNVLTSSGFNYEVASLYRAHELNLPVKYVELGNEFYLSDEEYMEVFPSSFDYISKANLFTQQLKSLAPFELVKVAVVGTSLSNNSSARRSNWLNIVLSKISTSGHRPDAITIHEYYTSGLNDPIISTFGNSNIGKMFIKPFTKGDDLISNEIKAIKDKNTAYNLNPPLEVWLTEYNMNDDVSNNVGTWAHGLFNSIQTLKYLEAPLITHVCSHAMTSDAVYGNIFESDRGFENLTNGQLPANVSIQGAVNFATEKYGFTASGAALNEIALAMKGTNVVAHRIDFSGNANDIGEISYYDNLGVLHTSTLLNLYGWSFEKEEGFEAIILNLGNLDYNITDACSLGIFTSSSNCPQSFVQLFAIDPTSGIGSIDPIPFGSPNPERLFTNGEINVTSPHQVLIPPYSLTRIIYRNPSTVTLRLTDSEICAGTQTSALIQGGSFGEPCSLTISTSPPTIISGSDSLIVFGEDIPVVSTTQIYTLTATVDGITSDPVTLTVQPAISVTAAILSNNNIPCLNEDIVLTATVNTTNPYSDVFQDYTYLWVPDHQISDHNPFQQSITIANADLKSDAYQVFVYDGFCWASSNVIEIDRGPVSIDLGEDFTVCYTNDFNLRAITTTSPLLTSGTLHYKWLVDNVEISNETTPDIEVTNLTVGTYTFRVEVWSDNGIIENENCPQWDEIEINVVNCCSCSNSVEISSHRYPLDPNIEGPVYNIAHEEDLFDAINNLPGQYNVSAIVGGVVTISPNTTNPPPPICINGEFWIRYIKGSSVRHTIKFEKCSLNLGQDASIKIRGRAKLILEGCVVTSCGNTNMWDGIYVDVSNEALAEPELEITKFITTPTAISTTIMNAKNAIVARRESPFLIENCIFENNYKDILLEKYLKSGTAQDATVIKGCTFKKTATLLAPYDVTDLKFTALELNDIEGRTIGSVTSANAISNSLYGIFSHNASFILLNTDFNNIEEDVLFPESGTGIYATSDFDFTNRKITLGNGNTNGSNTFKNSINGLMGVGEMNYYIYNNIFGSSSSSEPISKFCIKIKDSYWKEILIEDENEFFDYTYGIDIASPRGILYIHNNTFFNANYTNSSFFEGSAINVYGFYPIRHEGSEISLNTIGNSSSSPSQQARIGIRISNLERIDLFDNKIYFNHSSAPTDMFSGIYLQYCNKARLDGNLVENVNGTFPIGSHSFLTGLRIHSSTNTCIENSELNNLGHSMEFAGESVVNSLFTNIITNFDTAIFLVSANIGATQGDLPSRTVLNNQWYRTNMVNNSANRVFGTIQGISGIDWYHHPSTNTPNEFEPNASGVVGVTELTLPYTIASLCPTSFAFNVEDAPPYSAINRNINYGYIVGDSGRFETENYFAFKYLTRGELYLTLKNNPELLSMSDEADDSFVEFYEDMRSSNYQKFDSAFMLMEKGELLNAENIVISIDDTNDIEYNLKTALKIYLHSLLVDSVINSVDSSLLIEIANRNPLIGGNGVFMARNLLNLEIYDKEESGSRQSSFDQSKVVNKSIKVFPIPTKDAFHIIPEGDFNPEGMELRSIKGELVYAGEFKSYFNIDFVKSGIYILKVYSGSFSLHSKIVKLP